MRTLLSAAVAALFALSSSAATAQQPSARKVGRIAAVEGDVRYNGQPAKLGQSVYEGAVVETGLGRATVLVGGESVVHIDENSRFRFSNYAEGAATQTDVAVMDLTYGRTRALIKKSDARKKRFQFRTRAAVMGVRGTHIYIDSPRDFDKPMTFVTIEGLADVYVPQVRMTKAADALALQNSDVNDASKFRKVELRASETIAHDARNPAPFPKPERLPEKDLRRIGSSIVQPARYARTEEELTEEQRDQKRRQRVRERELLLHGDLLDRVVFDPVADGGVLAPVTIDSTVSVKPVGDPN